jgi:hypothetical protein
VTLVYINGDSHAAGAEAAVPAAFAEDLGYPELGRQPHPENLKASWGYLLAKRLSAELVCDAESASSNQRIESTTRQWLSTVPPWEEVLVVIGWSTWERESWTVDGQRYEVGSSGIDWVPESLQQRYKEFVVNVDWRACQQREHQRIWQLHQDLTAQKIPHVFFNCNNTFDRIREKFKWSTNYIGPYDSSLTYDSILRFADFTTVRPESWHFGKDAHEFWADFMLQYINQYSILDQYAIPTN